MRGFTVFQLKTIDYIHKHLSNGLGQSEYRYLRKTTLYPFQYNNTIGMEGKTYI